MEQQIWYSLLLLIAGGALTAIGTWISDLRSERRRKKVKLEEAYLMWLNNQSPVISRLKELTRLAEKEPESAQAHELLLEKFENLSSNLQNLTSALNLAFIYERDRHKKALIEEQSMHYALLTEKLEIILRHHRTHLHFHETIDEMKNGLSRLEMLKQDSEALRHELSRLEEAFSADIPDDIAEIHELAQRSRDDIAEVYEIAQRAREAARTHLLRCSEQLSSNATELSKQIIVIEAKSPALRRALVE